MANTNVNVAGVVKFFNQAKGFGIIITKVGDVFIHVSKAGGRQAELIEGAEVHIDFTSAYKDGKIQHSATTLLSVKAPPAPVEVLDVVKFYNSEKNFGFMFCGGHGFSKDEAILRGAVVKKAEPWEVTPGKGMAVRALIVQKPEGPEVLSFEWGPEVEAAYAAKLGELHAEDGAVVVDEDEQSDVDVLMADHARETQQAIGQLPPEAETEVEVAEEAPAKPKPKRARKQKAEKPQTVEAVVAACAMNGSGGAMADAFVSAMTH